MWFPVHLLGPVIPDPSAQLAELIVYITSTRVDLHSHQILLVSTGSDNGLSPVGLSWTVDKPSSEPVMS